MSIKIRQSIPDDVYGIQNVRRKTWPKQYLKKKEGITLEDILSKFADDNTPAGQRKLEEWKKHYQDKNFKGWVAEIGNEIIGFCDAGKQKNNNRIFGIYVLSEHQNKGLGSLLIDEAFKWLGKEREILVNVARYNQQAINFYQKQGFTRTGKSGVFDRAAKLPSGKAIVEIEMRKEF